MSIIVHSNFPKFFCIKGDFFAYELSANHRLKTAAVDDLTVEIAVRKFQEINPSEVQRLDSQDGFASS